MGFKDQPNVKNLGIDIAANHNMQSKYKIDENFGNFCS